MKKKILMLMIVGIFLFSFAPMVNAVDCQNPGLPNPQPINIQTELIQTCDTCTYTNISSITTPNSTEIINTAMTKEGTTYNYSYTPNQVGFYFYSVIGDKNGEKKEETLCFQVTPSGKTSSTSESILYSVLVFIFFGLTGLLFYFIIVTPYYNDRNENDAVIGINKLKYLKVTLIAIMYPIVIILLNFLNGLSQNFTTLSIFGGTIGFLFEIMLKGAWPYTIFIMIWIIVLLIRDSNFKKLIKSGKYY